MPFKLVAMHIHGGGQLDRNFSFGVSVKHVEFVRAYLVSVLPYLKRSIKSVSDVHPEALTTLQNYFTAVDASIQRLQMQHLVADFQTAVQVIMLRRSCGQCIALHCLIIGWVQYLKHPPSELLTSRSSSPLSG